MLSIVCSIEDVRLAAISEAIDEVAASAHAAGTVTAMADMTARLAGIWAMVAELDPALAERLHGYTARTDVPDGE